MFKMLAAVSALAICFTAGALAQTGAGAAANTTAASASAPSQTPPPVESMTCAQMSAEITADGQLMSRQLDPQFGADAQTQYNQAMQKEREIQAQAPANALACMIPFVCAAAQHQQQQQAQADAAQNQAQAQTQMNRLNASMNGIDQSRVQALNARFQAQHCQTPH